MLKQRNVSMIGWQHSKGSDCIHDRRATIGLGVCHFRLVAAVAIAAALLTAVSGASASIIALDEDTQGKGNKGTEFRPADPADGLAGFLMTARSSVDSAQPFVADAAGLLGTVVIDKKGAGVQAADAKGSKGISGGGGHKDEELIFTHDTPVFLDSILLGLNHIKFGDGLGDDDDPVIFLSVAGSGSFGVTIMEDEILGAFTASGSKSGVVDFGEFTSLADDTPIAAFKIRETNDHIYVNQVSTGQPIPEPGILGLLALGGLALSLRKRKA